MKHIYHYTTFECFENMLTDKGINVKAFHYSKYGTLDYGWTVKIVTPIIEEICQEKGWYFDIDDPIDPFFVSFCKVENSGRMWNDFGDNYYGVQLVFNNEVLEKFALKDNNPDVCLDCIYTDEKEDMKAFLLGKGWESYLVHTVNDKQGDLKDISVFILKQCLFYEQEYRYMIPHYKVIHSSYTEGFSEEIIEPGDYRYVLFPKDALVGINIGSRSDVEKKEILDLLEKYGYNDIEVKKMEVEYED